MAISADAKARLEKLGVNLDPEAKLSEVGESVRKTRIKLDEKHHKLQDAWRSSDPSASFLKVLHQVALGEMPDDEEGGSSGLPLPDDWLSSYAAATKQCIQELGLSLQEGIQLILSNVENLHAAVLDQKAKRDPQMESMNKQLNHIQDTLRNVRQSQGDIKFGKFSSQT